MTALLLFALPALAASSSPDETVVNAVSALYGKPVPAQAICVGEPDLPDEFSGSPVPVGVMRGAAGCRLVGVVVNGAWTDTAEALPKSLGDAWGSARQAKRQELVESWTRQVLLAFDQLDPASKLVPRSGATGGFEVDATFWQRTDERHVARHTNATFYFDKDARLETADRDRGTDWRTTFYVQDYKVDGVAASDVMGALKQQGRTLTGCMDEAWKADHTVEGRVRMQWTIRDGQATQLAMLDEGDTDEQLASCYGSALRKIRFPEGMGGTVIWSFSVVRTEVKPEAAE